MKLSVKSYSVRLMMCILFAIICEASFNKEISDMVTPKMVRSV